MWRVKTLMTPAQTPGGDLAQTLVSGTIGGLVATAFNAPFDNVPFQF